MRSPGGYITIVDPDPGRGIPHLVEKDTFTCCHCNALVEVTPFQSASQAGGWCGRCAKPVCGRCADRGICVPLEEQLRRMEARGATLRSLEGVSR